MPLDTARIDTWIFDLDNTLYPPSIALFDHIDRKMGEYISKLLGCGAAEARAVQKLYFHDHGTTLAGLMHNHDIDPHEFLDFVHDIDLSALADAPPLADALAALPGRRLIFTNADAAYAGRVLEGLGIAHLFDGVFDILAMQLLPKPEPAAYQMLVAALDVDPARAVFLEDMARNLPPAKALGMQTVWIDCNSESGARAKQDAAIDLVIPDLAAWLAGGLDWVLDRGPDQLPA